jgi:hypothetical protein
VLWNRNFHTALRATASDGIGSYQPAIGTLGLLLYFAYLLCSVFFCWLICCFLLVHIICLFPSLVLVVYFSFLLCFSLFVCFLFFCVVLVVCLLPFASIVSMFVSLPSCASLCLFPFSELLQMLLFYQSFISSHFIFGLFPNYIIYKINDASLKI